jgi:hypothetical protein
MTHGGGIFQSELLERIFRHKKTVQRASNFDAKQPNKVGSSGGHGPGCATQILFLIVQIPEMELAL